MSVHDTVIRGGTVIDGSGAPARAADVAVTDGRITAVGEIAETGRREVDADGALITPGFVDIHTHYDGQATWDTRLQPSSSHGVTTVVMGNCGVGFAPVHPHDRARLIELMEGVEDLPGSVLSEGLSWTWQTFEEYLDALDTPHDVDFAAHVPHAALRVYVMGQRGADREPATPDDVAEMGTLAARAVEAGALGFSTSRTLNHKSSKGDYTPSLTASRRELVGIAEAIGRTGKGVCQVVSDLTDVDDEMTTFREMVRASGRPLSLSLMQTTAGHDYRRTLELVRLANEQGLPTTAVVAPRADLGDPTVKRRVLDEVAGRGGVRFPLERVFELGDPPAYEPEPSSSIVARAHRMGCSATELLYDVLLTGPAYWPVMNYFDGNLDVVREMLAHAYAVPGLGDGGAHVGTICDASFTTSLLTHWGRDRDRGRFSLPWLVHRQCRATAQMVGLNDRGLLAPGYKADLNVIDFDELHPRPPRIVADLPGGGRRVLQSAVGYVHTFVNGVEVYAHGESTGELPGRLVRSRA